MIASFVGVGSPIFLTTADMGLKASAGRFKLQGYEKSPELLTGSPLRQRALGKAGTLLYWKPVDPGLPLHPRPLSP